jgi:pimeloyl-ACP methyl ester carboxylesterase
MDFRWPPPPEGRPDRYRPAVSRGPQTGRPTLPAPPTELVTTPHGVELECLTVGLPVPGPAEGQAVDDTVGAAAAPVGAFGPAGPVTVFAHGLAGSIPETRPLGSAVNGRKVFFHFRGHGRSASPPGRWTYADLARDLRAVADLYGATRALGVSLGAGALCRLLADNPRRFDRLVFFLPAVLDEPRPAAARERLTAILDAVDDGDTAAVIELAAAGIPADLRGTAPVRAYLRQRVDQLLRDGLAPAVADLPDEAALGSAAALADVTAPALVIGCAGDDLHPPDVAERLAAHLPSAVLHVYDEPGILWTHRADLRERIAGFLNG